MKVKPPPHPLQHLDSVQQCADAIRHLADRITKIEERITKSDSITNHNTRDIYNCINAIKKEFDEQRNENV